MGIGKFMRNTLRAQKLKFRNMEVVAVMGTITGVVTVATGGVAAPFFIFPAIFGLLEYRHNANMIEYFKNVTQSVNGCRMVGDKDDLFKISMLQEDINKWTEKNQYQQVLPEKIQNKIRKYVSDVTDVLSRITVYKSGYSDERAAEFSFVRNMKDAYGYTVSQVVAVVDLNPIEVIEAPKPIKLSVPVKFVPLPKTAALPAPDTLKIEFGKPSGAQKADLQIEYLQQRVETLERENAELLANKAEAENTKQVFKK